MVLRRHISREINMKDVANTSAIDSAALREGASTILPLAGRLLLGAIFFVSGLGKIADPAGTIGYITSVGLPFPHAVLALAIVVEVLGSVLLILGFRTRLVAGALACFTIVAALNFHSDLADQNQFVHFMKNFALAGGLLQVVAFGAGRYSIGGQA
jgi:putative oxidoreductase